jgi:hypothetical protein
MDNKNDTKQIRDNVRDVSILQKLDIFSGNDSSAYIYKKSERISVALYLITNLIKDNEPAKWEIRKSVLQMISDVLYFSRNVSSDRKNVIKDISVSVLRIVSMLETLFRAGVVSEMNFTIMKRELMLLVQIAESEAESGISGKILSDDMFDVPRISDDGAQVSRAGRQVRKVITNSAVGNSDTSYQGVASQDTEAQPNGHTIGHSKGQLSLGRDNSGVMAVKRDERTNSIINLLKTKSNLTVKDFLQVIPDCSEKTIQRELVRLVAENVLKKDGERRWTRYSLM